MIVLIIHTIKIEFLLKKSFRDKLRNHKNIIF